ncbi:MAG: hypothetical protein HY731_15240, partial [Candidatus Tectomicrobia bacterium]|nr:hypothetical protein [Candidatus Tectomicrobia bacterium]
MSRVSVYLMTIVLCIFAVVGGGVRTEDSPDHLFGESRAADLLQEHLERIEKKIGALKERLTPLLAYQLPTVELAFQRVKRGSLKISIEQVDRLADLLLEGKDPFEGKKGDFFKAYRSEVDGTLQPYRIFIPSSYGNGQNFPLLIALHGYQDTEDAYFDEERYGKGEIKGYAEEGGYLIVCPYGRGDSGYKGLG